MALCNFHSLLCLPSSPRDPILLLHSSVHILAHKIITLSSRINHCRKTNLMILQILISTASINLNGMINLSSRINKLSKKNKKQKNKTKIKKISLIKVYKAKKIVKPHKKLSKPNVTQTHHQFTR